jgi:hypothetical protein
MSRCPLPVERPAGGNFLECGEHRRFGFLSRKGKAKAAMLAALQGSWAGRANGPGKIVLHLGTLVIDGSGSDWDPPTPPR